MKIGDLKVGDWVMRHKPVDMRRSGCAIGRVVEIGDYDVRVEWKNGGKRSTRLMPEYLQRAHAPM